MKVGFDPATQATAADAKTALLAGGLKSLIVSVPVEGLESGDASLDKRLQKTLKPEVAPIIRFTLGSYESEAAGDVVTVKAHGKLAIAGVEKDAGLTATCTFGPAGIHVTGTTDVLMTDFGIKPPTMMLGAIKTADKVVVHFDIELQAN
ncbi:MAG: YceI family protein [Acidobacteriota bacterium]